MSDFRQLVGPQPTVTNFFTDLLDVQVDARLATWSGEFYVLNKLKRSAAVNWIGGVVVGSFPADTSWDRMHSAYAFSLEDSPEATIQLARIHNTGDAFSLKGASHQAIIYGNHATYVRDDFLQNDFGTSNLIIEDNLVDGCYSFFSSRPYAADVPDNSGVFETVIEKNCVYLKDMPTVYNKPLGVIGHAKFFKMDNAKQLGWPGHPRDPKLSVVGNVFRVDTPHVTNTDFMIPPPDRTNRSEGNIMVWGGAGSFPYPIYPGWEVTTDLSVWDNARAAWLARHASLSLAFAPPA